MPQGRWTRSREAALLRKLCPDDAAAELMQSYETTAGEEALFKALLAERDLDQGGTEFWIAVYFNVWIRRKHIQ